MTEHSSPRPTRSVGVWDLPTRLFHWSLVGLVMLSIVTGLIGGVWQMDAHMLSGYAILALLGFRLAWGVVGSRHSRFSDFVKGPTTILAYLRGRIDGGLGHNPAGALSVLAMLALLALQAGTGLCANDDILTEGPLAATVGKELSDTLTWVHKLTSNALMGLIALHLLAIGSYLLRGDNLIRPMLTGRKAVPLDHPAQDRPFALWWPAPLLLALCGGLVTWVVRG